MNPPQLMHHLPSDQAKPGFQPYLRPFIRIKIFGHYSPGNLVLWTRSELNGFAGKDNKLFWSTGILEYWSVGKSLNPNFSLNMSLSSLHYSITPLFQQIPASSKDSKSPLWGQLKAGSSGPGFFAYLARPFNFINWSVNETRCHRSSSFTESS